MAARPPVPVGGTPYRGPERGGPGGTSRSAAFRSQSWDTFRSIERMAAPVVRHNDRARLTTR